MKTVCGPVVPALVMLVLASIPAAAAECPSWKEGMPPEILSYREEILSKEAYADLARQWAEYAGRNPGSAVAESQWSRALRYAGADAEEEGKHVRKAYALDSKCPEALEGLGHFLLRTAKEDRSLREGIGYARTAAKLAPEWPVPHMTIWGALTQVGDYDEADREIRTLLEMGGFEAPVLDFGYNLLMSAAPGAIVLTNGDNDTYPLLALQKARGIRPDVAVINLSLLNLVDYGAHAFDAFPGGTPPLTGDDVRALKASWNLKPERPFSMSVVETLFDRVARGEWTKPVYMAVTVAGPFQEIGGRELEIEGLLYRVTPRPKSAADETTPLNTARTLDLFRREFRLDSATDPVYAWPRRSAVRQLVRNYGAVLQLLASRSAESGDREGAVFALDRAIRLFDFHGETETVRRLARYWKDLDPKSHEPDRWL